MKPRSSRALGGSQDGPPPDLAAALQACGLPITTVLGVSFVEIDAHHYAPVAGGKPAIIVPLFEDGTLLDLIATGLQTRTTRTRAGIAMVLGQEWIDRAKDTGTALRLFRRSNRMASQRATRRRCRGLASCTLRAGRRS